MPGAGWTGVLLPRGEQLFDVLEGKADAQLPPYKPALAWNGADPMLNASGGKVEEASWNHKSAAWSIELLRAVLAKDGQQTTAAEEAVLSAYFPRELGIGSAGVGLWGPEQGAPDPHGGQELVGVSLVLCAALLLDAHGDASLLEGARQLVAANAE